MCGMPSKDLSKYITRKKVAVGDDGLINDQIEQNAAFLAKRRSMKGDITADDVSPNYARPAAKKSATKPTGDADERSETLYGIDKRRRELDIETKQRDLELKNMEIDKRMGRLIPVDHVKIIFGTHARSITTAMSQLLDGHLIEISKRAKFTAEEMATMRGSMRDKMNDAIKRAVDDSKRSVESAIKEFVTIRSTR
jgi:hypothetical protein